MVTRCSSRRSVFEATHFNSLEVNFASLRMQRSALDLAFRIRSGLRGTSPCRAGKKCCSRRSLDLYWSAAAPLRVKHKAF